MKIVTLDDVIREKCKDPEFAELFQRELLINEIAKVVVDLRKRARLTQQELAIKAKTTQPVIARLERGTDHRMPSLELIAKLANAAGATIKLVVDHKGKSL